MGASRRKDHVLQFVDKKIEVRCGKHRVSSMWREVRVSRKGGIVPVQFRKVHDV